jgi:dTDP-4-amino-4,6-dideoxygalactose transaminase
MYAAPFTRNPGLRLPLAEEFHSRELTLPLHPKMETGDVERVVAALADALRMTRGAAA